MKQMNDAAIVQVQKMPQRKDSEQLRLSELSRSKPMSVIRKDLLRKCQRFPNHAER